MTTIWNLGILGAEGFLSSKEQHPCYPICSDSEDWKYLDDDDQKCEICGTARQSHGNLFEDRVAAYICLEMMDQNQADAIELWKEWKLMTSGPGRLDVYDIDFGSGTPEKCKAMGCESHFPSLEKSDEGQRILTAMHTKYGIGISVKVTGTGAAKTASMCAIDMGDACRVSAEMDASPPGWSLIVGQWIKKTELQGAVCKCIIKVYQLTKITSAIREILYNKVDTPCIDTFVAKYYKQGSTSPTVGRYTEHKAAFKADRKALGCKLGLGPKSNKRCQCTISASLFVKLMTALEESTVEGAGAGELSPSSFPHLFKPIYREQDQPKGKKTTKRKKKGSKPSRKKRVKRGDTKGGGIRTRKRGSGERKRTRRLRRRRRKVTRRHRH